MRVITLLPAATEIVAALGGAGHLVGISHECDYPASVQRPSPGYHHADRSRRARAGSSMRRCAGCRQAGQSGHWRRRRPGLRRLAPDLIITQALVRGLRGVRW